MNSRHKSGHRHCAIYTRKSTEEGLEQAFNSLDAQREACEAYITSQRHEGWRLVKTAYDDGGISGGTMERPGLQNLLKDIEAGNVDVVVVYKVDRLTRSLADFARMIEIFDTHDVSFVSVTQQFNTTSSMGRLTLNVLLSFAQFEREVTGERIRDKIAASKKKGMWMGGPVPLGYNAVDRKLVVNPDEAQTVRTLFDLYVEHGCVRKVVEGLRKKGLVTKVRVSASGRKTGGKPFSRGHIYWVLHNPLYVGDIAHKNEIHQGEHEPIVPRNLWNTVQETLRRNRVAAVNGSKSKYPSLLTGLIFDDRGNSMSPSHAVRKGKRYRYYVSQAILQHRKHEAGSFARLPAHDVERLVSNELREFLTSPARLLALYGDQDQPHPEEQVRIITYAKSLSDDWSGMIPGDRASLVRGIVKQVTVSRENLEIVFSKTALLHAAGSRTAVAPTTSARSAADDVRVEVKARLRRCQGGAKLVIDGPERPQTATPNAALQKAVARGYFWNQKLVEGEIPSIRSIARKEGLSARYVRRILPLAFLAPDFIDAILDGTQPSSLSVAGLSDELPLDWDEQRERYGFQG